MAKRTKIVIIDDVTGGEIEDGGQTIAFSVLGVDYSIDLSPENADKFHAALEPYINAAERVGGRNNRRAASQALGGPIDTNAVRAWAANNGVEFPARGRIPARVVDQFRGRRQLTIVAETSQSFSEPGDRDVPQDTALVVDHVAGAAAESPFIDTSPRGPGAS